jgi:hypothetical protein
VAFARQGGAWEPETSDGGKQALALWIEVTEKDSEEAWEGVMEQLQQGEVDTKEGQQVVGSPSECVCVSVCHASESKRVRWGSTDQGR